MSPSRDMNVIHAELWKFPGVSMVFKPLNSLEKKVLECITKGINSAPLIQNALNKGKKRKYPKTNVYNAIKSLRARRMIEPDEVSGRTITYHPVNAGREDHIGDVESPHAPNECRVHFTGTFVFDVVSEGDLERLQDSAGFTIGGWRPFKPGMNGVTDRWGYIRLNGQDNTIRFRKTKKICRMSVYPKEIWREIPKGTTDDEALGWFRDKAQLIADLLKFSGWQLKNMSVHGEVKPGKGVHYGYPDHPLSALKGKINHMDTGRTVDIDSSPGDSAELEGFTAEDGYILGHITEVIKDADGKASASLENLSKLRMRVDVIEGILDKLVVCEEKVAFIETKRLERETNEIVGRYEPKVFRQEGYQ